MASITIFWNAGFDYPVTEEMAASYRLEGIDPAAHATFNLPTDDMEDAEILERLFEETNLYRGEWWDAMQADLPPNRHHTALSVGDAVTIDGRRWFCAPVGWETVVERFRRRQARRARLAALGA